MERKYMEINQFERYNSLEWTIKDGHLRVKGINDQNENMIESCTTEADMRSGKATYWQLTSLQAFWPGLQILVGDVAAANVSHREFYDIWRRFGVLPERYLLDRDMLHPTERYYPLRPELAESTFYLYEATKDPWYMEVGESIVDSLIATLKLKVVLLVLEMLLQCSQRIISTASFSLKRHPLPIRSSWHEKLPGSYIPENWTTVKNEDLVFYTSSLSRQVCPATARTNTIRHVESACHVPDYNVDHRCRTGNDCGVDSTTCRQRTCSLAGYCGLWAFID
ncbi:hypothetical protein HPP92_016988 [Vanilla planifolia]|uniref:alpha-1,2-Mannosidase n=1 Tax=Vanilla planifolia TaxID=51239 RepID=A0A835QP98_VANPL|nr:hypothetical protein HPP92_016988 [Vanilla planifolia]